MIVNNWLKNFMNADIASVWRLGGYMGLFFPFCVGNQSPFILS